MGKQMKMRMICCVCHKTKGANGWVKHFVLQSKMVSHGYCPQCFQVTMEKVQAEYLRRGLMN